MKIFNLLRKSERKSVGTTLALTVGSPSFDRRGTMLKHYAFMLLFLLGSLNVWGGEETFNTTNSVFSNGTKTIAPITITFASSGPSWQSDHVRFYSNNTLNISCTSGYTITDVTINAKSSYTSAVLSGFDANSGKTQFTWSGSATSIDVTNTGSGQARITSIFVTYLASSSPDPSLSVTPATIDFGTVEQGASVAAKTVAVTYANLTGSVTYSGLSDAFTATGTISASGDEITITPSTATIGEHEQTLTIQSMADSKSQDVTVTMNVVAPFNGTKLTFGFSSNPGEWPTTNSTTTSNYTYTLNEVDYTFALNNVKCNSGYLMLTSVAKLGLPAIEGYKLVKVEATNSSKCSTTTKVKVTSDETGTVIAGGEEQTWATTNTKYTYTLSETEANTMYYLYISNKNCQLVTLELYYEEVAAAAVAKPTISGETPFLTSTTVTLTQAEADAIYYTTDGSDPKKSGTKLTYSAPFTVNADGTTTVKAYAVKGSDESDVAEKTFTKITPLTVAQALGEATGSGKYVTGTITSITEVSVANGNATYVISDISAGVKQNEMIVYRGKYVGGADFTSADQIHVGDVVVVSGSISQYKSVNQMAQGNQIETISSAAVAAPEFTPNGGGFVVSTDVTITCATAGNAIYYTTDGTSPTKSSTLYEGAIHLDATTTINAIAYIGEESSLVVEKTFTLTAPMTVAEACAALGSEDPINNAAVSGIVYQVDHCTAGGNATYWISDDGTNAGSVLEVFNGYGLNGAAFVENGIRVGDEVVVFGNLTIFNTTIYEFSAGSRLLSLTRKTVESVAVTGTPTKTNYKVGDAFDPAGLTVTVTYNDASHATVAVADCGWEITPATFDAAGTGLSVNVKATYDGVQSPAFAVEGLNVKAVPTFGNSNYEWQLVTSDDQLVAGKYYVIASTAKGKVAGAISSDVLGTVNATIVDGAIAYNAFGTDQTADAASAVVFELGGTTGAWTLNEAIDELGQLAYKGNKTVKWETESTAAWAITIADNNATLVPAAANTYHMLYNVSSPRFTIYTSDPAANMLLPQLYVWALKTYKLRYNANGGENAPAAQPAVAGEATVTDAKPTYTGHIFNGWNTLIGGNGEAKAAGDVIDLSAGDVTLYAQWREPNTYSISYDANGGTLIEGESEITPTSVTEGNAYTIEENVYEVEGKLFIGWKANGVTYNAGQEIYPTENMTFVAQWGDPNVTDFMLVTDVKQLKDGDKVYIVAADYNVAMGTQHGTDYRNYVEIAKQNNRVVILNATPVEFTVGKDGDNFTFYDGTGFLYASSSDKNYLITKDVLDDNGKWAITIDAEGVASIIAQGANENNNLKWNNSSPRFSCYKSGQKAVSIYKRPDYSRNVSGNYATICLPKAGKIIGATLYEIAYYGETSKKIFFDEIVNGEMEAGIPYIFQPAAGVEKINVYYSDNTAENVEARDRNGLIGFYNLNDPEATHNITQNAGFYILYNNQYWLVSGRAAYVENYRAYIRLADITPSEPTLAPGRRRISMSVNDTQTTTGFENGELINGENGVQKVLIDGELFILRGEKMYDATGRLVK